MSRFKHFFSKRHTLSRRKEPCQDRVQKDEAHPDSNVEKTPQLPLSPTPVHTATYFQPVNDCFITPNSRFIAVAADAPRSHSSSTQSGSAIYNGAGVYEWSPSLSLALRAHPPQSLSTCTCTSTALTVDATYCITGTHSKGAQLWNAINGVISVRLSHSDVVRDVALSALGEFAATASSDGIVRMWDVNNGRHMSSFPHHAKAVNACAFTASDRRVVSAGRDNVVRVWDRQSTAQVFAFSAHSHYIMDVAAQTDGSIITSVGQDKRMIVWDVRQPMGPLADRTLMHSAYCCAMTPDASRIVVGGDHYTLYVFNLRNGSHFQLSSVPQERSVSSRATAERISSCSLSADGCTLVTVGASCGVNVWKLDEPPLDETDMRNVVEDSAPNEKSELVLVPQNFQPSITTVCTEIESVFMDYVNYGKSLQIKQVVRALIHDHELDTVNQIWEIYMAHVALKTLAKNGQVISPDIVGDEVQHGTFLFEKVYHKLSRLAPSKREQEYVKLILADAENAGLLGNDQRCVIIGDMRTIEYVSARIERFETITAQVYSEVTSRLVRVEDRIRSIGTEVKELHARFDDADKRAERATKITRYANLVKLGMALVPFAGTVGMAFVDGTASVLLSMDLHSTVEFFLDLFPTIGDFFVDQYLMNDSDDPQKESELQQPEARELNSLRLMELLVSENVRGRMSDNDLKQMDQLIEHFFGGDFRHAQSVITEIIEERFTSATNTEDVITTLPVEKDGSDEEVTLASFAKC